MQAVIFIDIAPDKAGIDYELCDAVFLHEARR